MSRKGQAKIREINPDPKFHDRTVTKFVNVVMKRGKKAVAEQILYGALDFVADRTKEDGLVVFKRALDNVRPAVEVRSRRVGGANYQVPVEVRPLRRSSLAMRWLVNFAKNRRGTMTANLAAANLPAVTPALEVSSRRILEGPPARLLKLEDLEPRARASQAAATPRREP